MQGFHPAPLLQVEGVCIVRPAVAQALDLQQLGWKTRKTASIAPDLIFSQNSASVAFLLPDIAAQPPQDAETLHTRQACCGICSCDQQTTDHGCAGWTAWARASSTASSCTAAREC